MASKAFNLVSKYLPAVFVAFVSSVVSFFGMLALSLRSDLGFGIFPIALTIAAFNGVFFGTLCFSDTERRDVSKHLLVIGLLFSALPASLTLFLPLLLLALGGYLAVLIFKRLDRKSCGADRNRRLTIILIAVICVMISIGVVLLWIARPMIRERAVKLFARAGGLAKVEQEANVLFTQYVTNGYFYLHRSDRTNFPSISALGQSVSFGAHSNLVIRSGPLTNPRFIYIFQSGLDTNQETVVNNRDFYTSKYIQVATNIFITR